jgi:hypothetical protein
VAAAPGSAATVRPERCDDGSCFICKLEDAVAWGIDDKAPAGSELAKFLGFDREPLRLNIVGVRMAWSLSDRFDDAMYLVMRLAPPALQAGIQAVSPDGLLRGVKTAYEHETKAYEDADKRLRVVRCREKSFLVARLCVSTDPGMEARRGEVEIDKRNCKKWIDELELAIPKLRTVQATWKDRFDELQRARKSGKRPGEDLIKAEARSRADYTELVRVLVGSDRERKAHNKLLSKPYARFKLDQPGPYLPKPGKRDPSKNPVAALEDVLNALKEKVVKDDERLANLNTKEFPISSRGWYVEGRALMAVGHYHHKDDRYKEDHGYRLDLHRALSALEESPPAIPNPALCVGRIPGMRVMSGRYIVDNPHRRDSGAGDFFVKAIEASRIVSPSGTEAESFVGEQLPTLWVRGSAYAFMRGKERVKVSKEVGRDSIIVYDEETPPGQPPGTPGVVPAGNVSIGDAKAHPHANAGKKIREIRDAKGTVVEPFWRANLPRLVVPQSGASPAVSISGLPPAIAHEVEAALGAAGGRGAARPGGLVLDSNDMVLLADRRSIRVGDAVGPANRATFKDRPQVLEVKRGAHVERFLAGKRPVIEVLRSHETGEVEIWRVDKGLATPLDDTATIVIETRSGPFDATAGSIVSLGPATVASIRSDPTLRHAPSKTKIDLSAARAVYARHPASGAPTDDDQFNTGECRLYLGRDAATKAYIPWLDIEGKGRELVGEFDVLYVLMSVSGTNIHRGHRVQLWEATGELVNDVHVDGKLKSDEPDWSKQNAGEIRSTRVSNWSEGCQVFPRLADFDLLLRLAVVAKRWECRAMGKECGRQRIQPGKSGDDDPSQDETLITMAYELLQVAAHKPGLLMRAADLHPDYGGRKECTEARKGLGVLWSRDESSLTEAQRSQMKKWERDQADWRRNFVRYLARRWRADYLSPCDLSGCDRKFSYSLIEATEEEIKDLDKKLAIVGKEWEGSLEAKPVP